jgi:hypothetical protein
MGVVRVFIMRRARAHWVSSDSRTWGMRPVRFFDIRSVGLNDVPSDSSVSQISTIEKY